MGNTDWLIISLSITRINALLTGVSLSIATAILYSSHCSINVTIVVLFSFKALPPIKTYINSDRFIHAPILNLKFKLLGGPAVK